MHFFKLTLVCAFLFACSTANQQTDVELAPEAIVKASTDNRHYRYIELPNQLKVLLVFDPLADKAAAALDVFAGSMDEPNGQQGLAHFLEHMLFLGTEKYPEADEYQTFISQHGGGHNAYTSFRHTNYFFDISPEYFDEALDRFAQFFIAPLFNEDYVHREKKAVNSEYLARIKSDGRKQLDALRQVMNQQHPASRFSVGSLDTLKDTSEQTLRQSLVKFFKRHYSASNMALVVVAPKSLNDMERQIRQTFAAVPGFDVGKAPSIATIFDKNNLPLLLEVEPEEVVRELTLMFPITDDEALYRTKPVAYLGNLLGHEGNGSLLAALKSCGWAEHLSAGKGLSDGLHSSLQISVGMTESGLKNWQAIVRLTFGYIELLQQQGVSQWRFNEQGSLAQMQFNFKGNAQPIREVGHLANSLHLYPASKVLQGPYLMDVYAEKDIQGIVNQLLPENLLVLKVHPDINATRKSPFYSTAFSDRSLDIQTVLDLPIPECASEIILPEENPYVPDNFVLVDTPDDANIKPARLALAEKGLEVWYAPDGQFKTPKVEFYGKLLTPLVKDAKASALMHLYLAVVQDNLNKETYPATLAGLSYGVAVDQQAIELRVSGFSDKLPLLVQHLVQTSRSPVFIESTVQRLKQSLQEGWLNSQKEEPYRQLISLIPRQVNDSVHDPLLLAAGLEDISVGDLAQFSELLWQSSTGLRLFFHGNISESEALDVGLKTANILLNNPSDIWPDNSLKQFEDVQNIEIAIEHNDSAVLRYYQAVDESYQSAAEFKLLRQLIKAPFFDQLRTQQQLGYIVAAVDITMEKLPGIGLLVQSPTATEAEVQQAIDVFLEEFKAHLQTLDSQQFDQYRQGVINSLQEKPSNLMQQAQRYWGSINLDYLDFDTREKVIEQIQQLDMHQMQAVFANQLLYKPKGLVISTKDLP